MDGSRSEFQSNIHITISFNRCIIVLIFKKDFDSGFWVLGIEIWVLRTGGNAGGEETKCRHKWPQLVVIGHRGNGMNMLLSSDIRMREIKENSILSFNTAAKFPIDFVELDVQVIN